MIELRDYPSEPIKSNITLRPPQIAAVNAVWDYYRRGNTGNVIISACTGFGKSVVCAKLSVDIVSLPNRRVLQLSHVAEILEQNFAELIRYYPSAPVGVYSASLGKRQLGHQILIAGIQSVYTKGWELGFFHAVLLDECHTLSPEQTSMYRTLFDVLRQINPNIRIIGLSATPWRMKGGLLTEGEDALFEAIVFNYGIADALKDKYLCPIIRKSSVVQADLSKVKTRGGEFVESDMQKAMDRDGLTQAALDEVFKYASDRKSWLIFCAGVEHATHVSMALNQRGIEARCVHGGTAKDVRKNIIESFKRQDIRAVTNNAVLTTGTNIPNIDLIVLLRGTKSPGLMLQICGRGMRLFPQKENCLLMDFAGNLERFGPIDQIRAPNPKKPGNGEMPEKVCPECHELCPISAHNCPACDYEFPIDKSWKHQRKASDAAVLSTDNLTWLTVDSVAYSRHKGKRALFDYMGSVEEEIKPDTLRVTYLCGANIYREWVCMEHTGYAKERANKWVGLRLICKEGTAMEDFYHLASVLSIEDVLSFPESKILKEPKRICLKPEGKYERIVDYEF